MANGPTELFRDFSSFKNEIDIGIGADRGALTLLNLNITVDYALGDFDSISMHEENKIKKDAKHFMKFPKEKDHTDLEIALNMAIELHADKLYLFGVTGARLDHTLVNIPTTYLSKIRKIKGMMVDRYKKLELTTPGKHIVTKEEE